MFARPNPGKVIAVGIDPATEFRQLGMPRFLGGAQSKIDQIIARPAMGIECIVNHGVFAMTRARIREREFSGATLNRTDGFAKDFRNSHGAARLTRSLCSIL